MEKRIFLYLTENFGVEVADHWSIWVTVAAIGILAWLSYIVCVQILIPVVNYITRKTRTEWDDDLLNENVLRAFSQLAPAILVASLLPAAFIQEASIQERISRLTKLYILWAAIRLILVFLRGVKDAFDHRHLFRSHNLEIVRQTIVLFVVIIGIIVGIGILTNRDPWAILTGLGASAAVLMLVFRDTILGFVAGIQLTVNKMLGKGDWIVAPKAGANGEVIDVRLTTVKVRNWDNSIITIPPYTLFTDSFQNFQAMREAGARRVSRSVLIDVDSVRYLEPEEVNRLNEQGLLASDEKRGVRQVNLGLFRRYMEEWLDHYPEIIPSSEDREDTLVMVRQLQPTPQGIPLELYFFTTRTQWKPFEHLQADVFDHLYAIIGNFGLSIYQAPSARNFSPV